MNGNASAGLIYLGAAGILGYLWISGKLGNLVGDVTAAISGSAPRATLAPKLPTFGNTGAR